jgi:hypothetical protein
VNADEKVQRWVELHFKEELHGGIAGTERGELNAHYRWCDQTKVEIIDQGPCWWSDVTYEGWVVEALVSCPHKEVANSNGPFPLIPLEIRLGGYELDEIIAELDELDEEEARDARSSER